MDTVYLDVFLAEVDGARDPDLGNALDVGMQTSVRLKPAGWPWSPRGRRPPPPRGHAYYALAPLRGRAATPRSTRR